MADQYCFLVFDFKGFILYLMASKADHSQNDLAVLGMMAVI
jgi:hypothetical protein